MVFHRVGVIAPDLGQDGLLGDNPPAGLQQVAHDLKFPCGQARFLLPAAQHAAYFPEKEYHFFPPER